MSHNSPQWKTIRDRSDLQRIIEDSRNKPAMIFKHRPSSPESLKVLGELEQNWTISSEMLDTYLIDTMQSKDICRDLTSITGVPDEFPQVFLFADGVTMYDEAHEMINVKKIKIALKIINRTFRWMETRV